MARQNHEEQLQKAVVQIFRLCLPVNVVWYHPPNGEYRSARTGAKLKAMGVRRGVADLAFVLPDGRAAFIELKAPKGKQTPDQELFAADVTDSQALYAVCRSIDEVKDTLKSWGVNLALGMN